MVWLGSQSVSLRFCAKIKLTPADQSEGIEHDGNVSEEADKG